MEKEGEAKRDQLKKSGFQVQLPNFQHPGRMQSLVDLILLLSLGEDEECRNNRRSFRMVRGASLLEY